MSENEWIAAARASLAAARLYGEAVREAVAARVAPAGAPDAALVTREQHRVHGLAWVAASIAALEATLDWAVRAEKAGRFTEVEALVLAVGFGEYCAQIASGLPMSAGEIVRPAALGTAEPARAFAAHPAAARLLAEGNTTETRARLAALLAEGARPDEGLGDEALDLIRGTMRSFTAEAITPHAHAWHLSDALIPDAVIAEMAQLGVFGICIPEAHGGLGLGKLATAGFRMRRGRLIG